MPILRRHHSRVALALLLPLAGLACRAPAALLPRGEPIPSCPGLPTVIPPYEGREYLLPTTTKPAWLLGGDFHFEWIVTSGPDRGQRYRDIASFTVAPDSMQAHGRGDFAYPYQVRLAPLGSHGPWHPPVRTWLVQHVTVHSRGDTTRRFGLTIVDDVPRGFDTGGTFLTLTQLDTARFAAAWRSWHLFQRRTWYGRRVLEPSAGYICAVRVSPEAGSSGLETTPNAAVRPTGWARGH